MTIYFDITSAILSQFSDISFAVDRFVVRVCYQYFGWLAVVG